jgi:hypothetical protein
MYGLCAPERRQSRDMRLPVCSSYGSKLSGALLDCRLRYRTCQLLFKLISQTIFDPISTWLASRSKACVCGRSNAGIVGLKPVGGMHVRLL